MANGSVLIVGAGPTGMTAAIECKRAGFEVRIIDKSDHMARWSQALVVQARTLEQMQRYGIAQEEIARGRKLHAAQLWSEGKQIVRIDLSKIQSRYNYALFIPQSETESVLNAHMESLGVRTERQTELVDVKQTDGAVSAKVRRGDGAVEEIQPRWLLGCDGAHSLVRETLQIPFEGASIELSFLLGDLEVEGEDAPGDALSVHLHHGDLVFMARLTDRLTRVIVATHQQQEQKGPDKELTLGDFQDALDRFSLRVRVRGRSG